MILCDREIMEALAQERERLRGEGRAAMEAAP